MPNPLSAVPRHVGSSLTTLTSVIKGSAEEEIKRALITKQRRLQLAELMGTPGSKDEAGATPKPEQADGFAKQMVEKIVQNIQLFVNKVHLRYEDSISSEVRPPMRPFSIHALPR